MTREDLFMANHEKHTAGQNAGPEAREAACKN